MLLQRRKQWLLLMDYHHLASVLLWRKRWQLGRMRRWRQRLQLHHLDFTPYVLLWRKWRLWMWQLLLIQLTALFVTQSGFHVRKA